MGFFRPFTYLARIANAECNLVSSGNLYTYRTRMISLIHNYSIAKLQMTLTDGGNGWMRISLLAGRCAGEEFALSRL